jgi:hypothetical protein
MLRLGKFNSSLRTLCIASIAMLGFVGATCKSTSNGPVLCGSTGAVTLDKTLTVSDPTYLLKTPAASSEQSCPAHFTFFFEWADPARLSSTAGWQAIPINVLQAFNVISSDGKVGGYFTGGLSKTGDDWEVHQQSSDASYNIIFDDHNATTSTSSVYSINTQLTSTNPGDSVKIIGTITYYTP